MKVSWCLFAAVGIVSLMTVVPVVAEEPAAVYVTFWFDTEDFILPQADDAAKRLAEMFTA